MNKNYTRGPWTWGTNYCGLYGSGPDNEVLTYERYEGMWVAFGDKQKANANLIPAAPDLLEALEELTSDIAERFDMESPSTNPGIKHAVEAAHKAIAKAKGE